MARTAGDLMLALDALGGPDHPDAKAWQLHLPAPRATALNAVRVLVLEQHPLAEADAEIVAVLRSLADRLADAGAKVEHASGRIPDLEETHQHYSAMAGVVTGREMSMRAEAWIDLLAARIAARQAWEQTFADFDVLLAPPFGTAAFAHNDSPMRERTLTINGNHVAYLPQRAWAGIASFPGLPSTCMPAGCTAAGLPVGVQIIGPIWEDRTTLHLAQLIEREIGTGVPAPSLE